MTFSFIFAVDPGITTGIAYGIVDHVSNATVADLIAVNAEGVTVEQLWDRDEIASGIQIATLFMAKRKEYLAMSRPRCGSVHLVIEDFILRSKVVSTKKEVLSPVRVTSAIETMLILKKIPLNGQTVYTKRQAADAKNYATNDRIRNEWDCWSVTKGKEHGRDAFRHWCAQVARIRNEITLPAVAGQAANRRGQRGSSTRVVRPRKA